MIYGMKYGLYHNIRVINYKPLQWDAHPRRPTVDGGRNPAPVGRWSTSHEKRSHKSLQFLNLHQQLPTDAGFLPSTGHVREPHKMIGLKEIKFKESWNYGCYGQWMFGLIMETSNLSLPLRELWTSTA